MSKLSVIIPVYNVEDYLRQCLDSIINQSLEDIQIICVNDGSKDNSLNILNEYAQKDNRIVVISQENQGQGIARNKGLEIANSMIKWLLPEYDIYCVYQKYPGELFEYPALRFAQWLSLRFNINIILYVHTKGAFHYEHAYQEKVRKLWKLEFTSPRKKIYVQLIKKNMTDIASPFRNGACTWYNGMFISNRAFNLINTIQYYKYNRWTYESLFINKNIRFRGILNDKITPNQIGFEQDRYINKKDLENKKKYQSFELLILLFSFLLFIVYIKLLLFFLLN